MTLARKIGPRLPLTHYDGLKNMEPWLFEYIKKDIQEIHRSGKEGPFGLDTDYDSSNLEAYRLRKINIMKDNLQEMAIAGGFPPMSSNELSYALTQMPGFDNIVPGMIADYISALNFELFEKKALYLTGRLIDQLAHTELNASAEFLRLPFPSCLIVLEGKTALDAMYAIAGAPVPDGNDPISVFISERSHDDGMQKLLISCFHSGRTQTYFHIKRELLIHPEWDIEKALKTDWGKLYEEHPDWEDAKIESFPHALADESPFYEEGLQFFRIIVNAILYISSNDPDIIECFPPKKELQERLTNVKSKVKKKKARNELNKTSELNFSALGSHLPPILVDKRQRGSPSDGESQSMSENATRFIVRGHWRNQACGEKRMERRLIWVQPYYKGPDMGELINRPYILK